MSKENWKKVIIATLKVIKLIIEAILQKNEESKERNEEIKLLFDK